MSRAARESSWHLLALVMVVAVLCAFAPIAWHRTRQPADRALGRDRGLAAQAQVAPLRPLVADQIDLDPSVVEGPALPLDSPQRRAASVASRQPLQLQPRIEELPLIQPGTPLEPGRPAEPAFPITRAWPYPSGLVEQLDELAVATPQAADWTRRVRSEIDQLVLAPSLADPAVQPHLLQLHQLAQEAKLLAESLGEESRARLLRAGFAIVRRLVIWDQVHAIAAQPELLTAAPVIDRQAFLNVLGDIDALLQATDTAVHWRRYLLIDRARDELAGTSATAREQRELARRILHRMHNTQLSGEQEAFLQTPPLASLERELRSWAAETPDLGGLLTAIERYEHDDWMANARDLALRYDALRWNPDPAVKELAETVNAYYRNANLRVAITGELINRMLPRAQTQLEPVHDVILGARVAGKSHTSTQLRLVLLPDEDRWNIGLEANGEVASNTASSKGPATFYQDGWSLFRARKRLIVDRRSIRLFSSEAAANANTQLNDFETHFDGIPLLGGIVRAIARNQYDSSQPQAKVEVESRIVGRATSQLDREVAQRLEQAKADFQVRMVDPLRRLELEPTAVDLESTAERLIGRYRLAGREQISAHTPRPQAPGDSLLSVQIHESAFNNVLERLNLAGREVSLHELFREMTTRFNLQDAEIPEDLPEDVYVTFADEEPVRIDAEEGRVRLTIRIQELAQGRRNRWTHFTVRGYYAPTADQLEANLEREGIIELISDNGTLRLSDQIALRGIFARVLSRNRKLNLVNEQLARAPELQDQQVTQFVIHDGWIGVALGPHAPGRQAFMQPKPELIGHGE